MVYIVKRRADKSNPSTVQATAETKWQYLDRHNRWVDEVKSARVFTEKGHAKNALKSHIWGRGEDRRASYRSAVALGDVVLIQPCSLVGKCGGEVWQVS